MLFLRIPRRGTAEAAGTAEVAAVPPPTQVLLPPKLLLVVMALDEVPMPMIDADVEESSPIMATVVMMVTPEGPLPPSSVEIPSSPVVVGDSVR